MTLRGARTVVRDGEPVWVLACPGCGCVQDLDDDQLHGRISSECACEKHSQRPGERWSDDVGEGSYGCGWHETRDWFSEAAP